MSQPTFGGTLKWIVLAAVAACATGESAGPVSNAQAIAAPTYSNSIQAIVEKHCTKCHLSGGVAPFPLTNFAETSGKASLMAAAVTNRIMPPWTAQDTDECKPPLPWRNDERLTDAEIAAISTWAENGAPEGNASNPPADPDPTITSATNPLQTSYVLDAPTYDLAPREPYLPITYRDDFRCFVMDLPPELANGAYISAIDAVPGDRRIVHHVTAFADTDGTASAEAGPDGSFDCSGSAVLASPGLTWLLSWAPGARPLDLPAQVGIELPAHAKILMQVHYSVGNRAIEPEATHLQLLMRDTKPEYLLKAWPIGNQTTQQENGDGLLPQPADDAADGSVEFRIPARASGHIEGMQGTWGVGDPQRLFGVRAHAHLAATDVKVDLLRGPGSADADHCLVEDRWDFHWQRVYTYDADIASLPLVRTGDRVRLRCTYDNTMSNPRLGQELFDRNLQPSDIYLGEATLDEMCFADILMLQPAD